MDPHLETLDSFIAAWELLADTAWANTLAAALLGFLGVYVVLRRMVFLSAALTQSAGLGVTASFYAQAHWGLTGVLVSPTAGAAYASALAVLLLMAARGSAHRRDSLLGLTWLVGGAGALAIGTRIVQDLPDIQTLLYGSPVAIEPDHFQLIAVLAVALLAVHLWWLRGFLQVSFDRDGAQVRGLPVRLLDLTLLVSIALAVSVSTRVLAALPVFAFSVLPAMAALRLSSNVPRALALATLIGALSGFGGYLVAFLYALPVGAAQTLVAAAFLPLCALLAALLRRLKPHPHEHPFRRAA